MSGNDEIKKLVEGLFDPPYGGDRFELMAEAIDDVAWVDFTEIRPALESQVVNLSNASGIDMTSSEMDTMSAVGSREYDEFYRKLKHSVYEGVWGYMLAAPTLLPVQIRSLPDYYNGPSIGLNTYGEFAIDAANGKVIAKVIDEFGDVEDTWEWWNVKAGTDRLFLHLTVTTLTDIADVYYSIQSLSSSDASRLTEEFFSTVQQFWFEPLSSAQQVVTDSEKARLLNALAYFHNLSILYPDVKKLESLWDMLCKRLVDHFEDLVKLIDKYTYHPSPVQMWWDFASFPQGSINLGLRLVYRQEWRHLGNQRGEVVRTVPLGPKQVERVSTRILRRNKVTRTAEDLKSVETTTERADTTKSSRDIVEEAASSLKWHLNTEVEGGINTGVYNLEGKTDAGIEQESRDSSREASSRLTETMQKIASKVRNETKVIVSTETEETFESTSSSEIQNPNDEIAVTYVYSKLQNQYEVLTRLAEIQNVVMVAEQLPSPEDINFDWVKKHDWILAKVLLDDSFRDALNSISQESRSIDSSSIVSDLQGARNKTIEHLGKFASTANVRADNIDMVVESQKAYRESAKEQLQELKLKYEMDAKHFRLYEHIRANILHYQRAIWQYEDPQQRLLRYKKMGKKVPLEWRFETSLGDSWTIDELEAHLSASDASGNIDGHFVSVPGGREVDLDKLVNPAGPIGYYGNYSLYYMRPEFAGDSVFSMLDFYKSPYMDTNPVTDRNEVMDPVHIQFINDHPVGNIRSQEIDAVLDEMFRTVPALRLELEKAKWRKESGSDPAAVSTLLTNYEMLKKYYAEFLFRQEQSRRFVVDTNSLVMDIIPGDGTTLEQFKLVHRGIDALKAFEEKEKLVKENERRDALLNIAKDYRDPDVERVIVVEGGGSTGQVAAAAAATQPVSGGGANTGGI